jgi:hypothetical protein
VAVVVVGGQTRNIGKTSVITAIISALPHMHWTAFKVSQHPHGITSDAANLTITEEFDTSSTTDTARFLQAGAVRSFLMCTRPGQLAAAMPRLRQEIAASENAIIESNTILQFLQPDLYFGVLNFSIADFKNSAQQSLHRTDAILLTSSPLMPTTAWPQELLDTLQRKPQFPLSPSSFMSASLNEFLKQHLGQK